MRDNAWIPGRLIGGTALIVGPLVFLAGLLVRYLGLQAADFTLRQQIWFNQQTFDAPSQLAAYAQHPGLVTAGYALFAAGAILLVPAVIAFARIVVRKSPTWRSGPARYSSSPCPRACTSPASTAPLSS